MRFVNSLFSIFLCFILVTANGNGANELKEKAPTRTHHIDETFTSADGCVVHIDGEIEYSVDWSNLDVEIHDFSGTVTLSGPGDCPNGTLTFGLIGGSGTDVGVSFDSNDACETNQVTWGNGPSDVLALLNSSQANQLIVDEVNNLCKD